MRGCVKRGVDLAFGSFGGLFYFGVRSGFHFPPYVVDSVICLLPLGGVVRAWPLSVVGEWFVCLPSRVRICMMSMV